MIFATSIQIYGTRSFGALPAWTSSWPEVLWAGFGCVCIKSYHLWNILCIFGQCFRNMKKITKTNQYSEDTPISNMQPLNILVIIELQRRSHISMFIFRNEFSVYSIILFNPSWRSMATTKKTDRNDAWALKIYSVMCKCRLFWTRCSFFSQNRFWKLIVHISNGILAF